MDYKANLDAMTPVARKLYFIGRNIVKAGEGPLPTVERGSPEWTAWRQWRKDHGESVGFMDRLDRWTVPTAYPPIDLDEADKEWNSRSGGGKARRVLEAIS